VYCTRLEQAADTIITRRDRFVAIALSLIPRVPDTVRFPGHVHQSTMAYYRGNNPIRDRTLPSRPHRDAVY